MEERICPECNLPLDPEAHGNKMSIKYVFPSTFQFRFLNVVIAESSAGIPVFLYQQ